MIGELEHRVREVRGEPEGAIVLLHGRGADEHDLFPLFDHLDPDGRLVGVCPRGPLMLPPGGAHWYVVRRVGYPDPATFFPTFETLSAWLDGFLDDRGIEPARTVIGGFSQGAVMSYSLGLGASRPLPAAVLAFSGFIPAVDGFDFDLEGHKQVPVAIAHGIDDPVISVSFAQRARDLLQSTGYEVSYRESPIAHAIDPAAVADAREVLSGALR